MTVQHWRFSATIVVGMMVLCGSAMHAQGLGPGGATARCVDGKFSMQKTQTLACRDHGGVTTWFGLASQGAQSESKKPDAFAQLEAIISHEPSYSVIRADPDGSVIGRGTDSAKVALYSYFTDYLNTERGESGCRRSSNHCVTCTIPGHRIYCTNVDKFLPLPPF